tara:strand:- start:191 stop:514 length:324 start_codon:yes stop_codon:yes gene_type:complete
MIEFILFSFIVFASTSIGYHIGRKAVPPPIKPVYVTVDALNDLRNIDNWFFPCNVIHIEIIERNESDEKFSRELNDVITKFVKDRSIEKSTFVKYCDGTSVYENYCN